jgi:phosphopantothenoylcysteine synthetase/decarboxylase
VTVGFYLSPDKVADDNIFTESCISQGLEMKHFNDRDEQYHFLDGRNDDYEFDGLDDHKKEVRRKLEDRIERRRLKLELEDYEGELDDDFDWDEHN